MPGFQMIVGSFNIPKLLREFPTLDSDALYVDCKPLSAAAHNPLATLFFENRYTRSF
jgi:hypothetical protein